MYLAQKPYYFLADGSVKTGLFSIKSEVVSPGIMPEPIISCLQTVPLPLAAKFTVSEQRKIISKGTSGFKWKKISDQCFRNRKDWRRKYKGKTYFFDSTGAMMIGKVTYKNKTYFTKANGTLAKKGWVTSNGKTYYLNSNGTLQTGWFKAKGKKYYADASGNKMGVPYIGVQQIKKKIYVFDSSGVLGKGWTVYGSRKYYANAKGEITRGFKTIDGKTYFFNDYGSMHTGWLYYNGKYYYLNPSDGVMVTGTKNIGGTSYTFSDSGISSRALEGNWTVKVNRQQNVVTVYKGNTPVRA